MLSKNQTIMMSELMVLVSYAQNFYLFTYFSLPADIKQACFYDDYFMVKEIKTIKCFACGHMKKGPRLETSVILVPVPRGMTEEVDDWIIHVSFHLFTF